MPLQVFTLEQRKELLQKEIHHYIRKGYHVISQTDTTAQLLKPKKFSLFWCIIMLGILYLPFYWASKDKTVYIEVIETGKVNKHK